MNLTLCLFSAEHQDFLFQLYASTRQQEFAQLGWPAAQLETFLRMQFNAQQREYQNAYPGSEQSIVLCKGSAVGRLWVARNDCEIHVVDISLLPEFQRHGIGTQLYRQLMAEAKAAAKPVRCSVSRFNDASLRFHQHLGFRVTAETEVILGMEACF